jgi:hypothetical protein
VSDRSFVPGGVSVVWLRFASIPASGSVSAWLYSENAGVPARSADWIKAEYRSMLPGAVTLAAAQSHL